MRKVVIPRCDINLPVYSTNKMYHGKVYRTAKYNKYSAALYDALPNKRAFQGGKLSLTVRLWVQPKFDIDNFLKAFIDALEYAYEFNDCKIYSLQIYKNNMTEDSHCSFRLTQIERVGTSYVDQLEFIPNTKLAIPPLSYNNMYKGVRFKSERYLMYIYKLLARLPNITLDDHNDTSTYGLSIDAYMRHRADLDNILKPFLDVLQTKYNINDNQIIELLCNKYYLSNQVSPHLLFSLTQLYERQCQHTGGKDTSTLSQLQ